MGYSAYLWARASSRSKQSIARTWAKRTSWQFVTNVRLLNSTALVNALAMASMGFEAGSREQSEARQRQGILCRFNASSHMRF